MKRGMRQHGRFMMAAAKFKAAAEPAELADQVQGDQGDQVQGDVEQAIAAAADAVIDQVIGGQ